MNILNKFRRPNAHKNPAATPPPSPALHEALEAARRARRAEQYDQAAEALNRALALASPDAVSQAVITVGQAEVYIEQQRWAEAEAALQKARQLAEVSSPRTHLAYVLDMYGALAQARQDWDQARAFYEQALETARAARSIGAEGRALGHLADTYLQDDNASYAIHLLRDALPKLALTGDVEYSAYFVGRLGQALILAGQEIEGWQLIERALRLSQQIGYRRCERRWSVITGDRALREGRYDEACAQFERALALFDADTLNPERTHALCRASRAFLGAQRTAQAVQSARQAVELATRLGSDASLAEARGALGMALLADHDHDGAVEYLRAAADFYAGANGGGGETLRSLGAALADSGQFDAAVNTYRRAISRAEQDGSRLSVAQARRDLGLLYAQHHDLPAAIREWSAALDIYEIEKHPAQVARLYCDIAAARKYLGQGQRALKDYEQALMAINDLKDDWETRGLVLSNAANAYVEQGDIESVEAFFNESIAIARRMGDEAAEATRRGNYGWFLLATGRPQQAIAALQYALQISKTRGLTLQAAIQTDNLGLAQDLMGSPLRALEYHQQAIEMVEPLDAPHWKQMFTANLAATLLALGRVDEAGPLFEAVLSAGRESGDVEAVARGLLGRAQIALRRDAPETAGAALNEAVSITRRADMRRLLAEALSLSSQNQAALNQPEQAAALWAEAQKLFHMLHMPQGRTPPVWLNHQPTNPA
ncbi:MAG: tetratricopeptide repeat protein [Chloroflexi bacterium]|nr:tetratricopeptide repeat protein [Chloroflexota bacterium]